MSVIIRDEGNDEPLEQYDPLFDPSNDRFVLFPIQYPQIWDMYKVAQKSFWVAEEIDLAEDLVDWSTKLNDDERYFITHVLAFFAASDGIVNENVVESFISKIQCSEARCFYGFQIAIENIHSETYSILIDTYVTDNEEKIRLLKAIETIPSINMKAEWAIRWINDENASFHEKLIAFAIVEGIFFSSSFCSIFWLKKRGLMPGLCFSNELISRDERLHVDFACLINSLLVNKTVTPERFKEMIDSAIECEEYYVKEGLPVGLVGMNEDVMCQYVRYKANELAYDLNFPKPYPSITDHPFPWMNMIELDSKSNLHERKNSQYQLYSATNKEEDQFDLNVTF